MSSLFVSLLLVNAFPYRLDKRKSCPREYFYLNGSLGRHLFRSLNNKLKNILFGNTTRWKGYFGAGTLRTSSGGGGNNNNSGHHRHQRGSDDDKNNNNNPIVSVYSSYISALEEKPVLTKAVTTSLINAFSDIIAQWMEQRGSGTLDWNIRRTFALGFWGLIFMGPYFHHWYLILERLFPVGRWSFLKKILLDQTFAAAVFTVTFFIGTGVLEGQNGSQIVDRIRHKFWPTMYANWRVWPLVQCITFTVIPLTYRVLWVNIVTIMWVVYFSSLAHSH